MGCQGFAEAFRRVDAERKFSLGQLLNKASEVMLASIKPVLLQSIQQMNS